MSLACFLNKNGRKEERGFDKRIVKKRSTLLQKKKAGAFFFLYSKSLMRSSIINRKLHKATCMSSDDISCYK